MKIVVDGMGGDRGSEEILKGISLALNEIPDIHIIVVGKEELLKKIIKKLNIDNNRFEVVNATETIEMDDDPVQAVRQKKDSSLNVGLELVKNGIGDAFVSAGNTGAHISASQLKLRRIKGILRPAIATVFPSKKGNFVFMDMGANADTKAEFINQFAIMGSEFAKDILKKEKPTVGLLNIGSEEGKGNEVTREAFNLLKENSSINFIGNIESRDMMDGKVDVIVTDGFTGNMVLKTSEGVAKFIFETLKEEIMKSFLAKIGFIFMKKALKKMKNKLDSSEYGGALFLGLNGISIKAHGNSDAIAFKNAIKVADKFAKNKFVEKLRTTFEEKEKNI
ncbi:phosphate acyltransferase PlsX [Fusobacterium perfoetens]|uniref:phosphate acyltransferase PlsX n=1 Tax=Fusobacterium perfoetens TaxID=852 RepID=UPI000485FAD1|nr:phosphate acyltransferase PlsX [Fusobacterium perfoetens]MCI6151697.1 phosphate acyltransferase PlsX [Fusobacterium perfoetens]MDY3236547.1 phosphate acyltransferase PlsX [Fusobacterium perfoetens]